MLGIGAFAFAVPWVLTALIVLPAIYWLLRVTPPAPRLMRFPAIRLLADLVVREETPDRTPWWLLALRLILAALIIIGLARPLLNPGADLPGGGPVILVVDNGWAAARDWPARQAMMESVIERAGRADRRIVLLPTAPMTPGERPAPTGLLRAGDALSLAEALTPHPWPTDRDAAFAGLADLTIEGSAHLVWLTDGLDNGQSESGSPDVDQALIGVASIEIIVPDPLETARLMRPPSAEGATLIGHAVRAAAGAADTAWMRLTAEDGRLLAREPAMFAEDALTAEAAFDLPVELRNEAVRLDIENETTAGAAILLDERWKRRPVGLISAGSADAAQPLLSDIHYLTRALEPFSEVREGDARSLLDGGVAALILPDSGVLPPEERETTERWIEGGGILVRFAGPVLAANPDRLAPVLLRYGDRVLSGALTWAEPAALASFLPESPFYGLTVPPDVRVERQVLAEPTLDLAGKTWARLDDGTPLVTAEQRGEGWLILVHVTAGPEWSNLPLSGLYVDMLRRIVALSDGVAGTSAAGPLAPLLTLDGFGRLGVPPASALPIAAPMAEAAIGPAHPPGFYGTEEARVAFNLGGAVDDLARLETFPRGADISGYSRAGEVDLAPWLLAAALALASLDLLIGLALRGLLPRWRRAAGAAAIVVVMAVIVPMQAPPAQAQEEALAEVANNTYLAYARTGIPEVDEVSRAGLESLSDIVMGRTAAETMGAVGVDVATDELAFYPLLYWPMVAEQPDLSPRAVARLNTYLQNGGTILFDTRDQAFGPAAGLTGGGPGTQRLQTLTRDLDIPPLSPVPPDHVLTKAFYLMQDFPGRYAGGEVWVENTDDTVNDGVSSVIVGSNDWASAWAVGPQGRPLFPMVPGGERQRELAFRFGVNLVMYTLTGNYKADQVHVPAILERLGQ